MPKVYPMTQNTRFLLHDYLELKAEEAREVANYCRYYQGLLPEEQKVARKEGKAKLRYMFNKENQRQLEACLGLSQEDTPKRK